jgi:hypothetical protein
LNGGYFENQDGRQKHGFNAYLNFYSLYYSKYIVIIGDNKHVGTTSLTMSDLGDKVIVIGVNKHVGTTFIVIFHGGHFEFQDGRR